VPDPHNTIGVLNAAMQTRSSQMLSSCTMYKEHPGFLLAHDVVLPKTQRLGHGIDLIVVSGLGKRLYFGFELRQKITLLW
jgi:hypothetical protein